MWYISGVPGFYYWTYYNDYNRPPIPRAGLTAVFVADNIFVVFGGVYQELSSWLVIAPPRLWQITISGYNTLEQWDVFSPTIPTVKGVVGHTSVIMPLTDLVNQSDHVMLVFGGLASDGHLSNSLLAIAPTLMFWDMINTTGVKPLPRAFHSAVRVGCCLVYIFGGLSSSHNVDALDNTWSVEWKPFGTSTTEPIWVCYNTSAKVPPARYAHTAVHLNDSSSGNVVIIFGGTNGIVVFDDVWKFVISTHQWQKMRVFGHKVPGVYGHTAVVLGSSMVTVGGCTCPPDNNITADAIPFPKCPSKSSLIGLTFYLQVFQNHCKWRLLETQKDTTLSPHYVNPQGCSADLWWLQWEF